MKKILFDVTVYSMLIWSVISFGYFGLPENVQAMLPQFNWVSSLISGSSTALMGFGGVAVQQYIALAKKKADEKYMLLAENYLAVENKIQTVTESNTVLSTQNQLLARKVDRLTTLIEADIKAKLSNPLIDEQVKSMIEGIINEKPQV